MSPRIRLMAGFAGALTLLLLGVGVFLYARFSSELDRTMNRDLAVRSAQLSGLVIRSPVSELPQPTSSWEPEESIAQVIRPDGRVVAASSHPAAALLTPAQRAAATRGALVIDRVGDAALDEHLRILAQPVRTRGETFLVLVASSLDERAEAMQALLRTEVLGLGGALGLATAAAWVAAGVVLRPLERGRRLQAAALERQRRFLADASHQLRTPLAVIRAEVDLARGIRPADADTGAAAPAAAERREARVAELTAALDSTGEEVDRLTALTDQLLLLAASDERRLALAPREVSLRTLLTAAAERTGSRARHERREIVVSADASLVRVDPERFGHALDTLVDNAIRHGAGPVDLSGTGVGDVVTVRVRDHGAGFPGSYLQQPFERFARGASGRGGTGLGLSIARAIVEAHGGRVRLGNEAGAVVTVDLPRSPTRG
jgi:two-component system, OmpR family, sensor kinase